MAASGRGWFRTANDFFDWKLPHVFRPTYRLVYLCLNRHANNRPGRVVKKVSLTKIAHATGLGRSTVERAVAFLRKIRLVTVKRQGGARRGDIRLTSVYCVAELDDFEREELCGAIARPRKRRRRGGWRAA